MKVRYLLEERAQKHADKPALIFQDTVTTFTDLKDNVLKLTSALKSLGLAKSDKVAFYLPNSTEYVYSYLACFCLGAVGVPLDYMLTSDELISCLSHSETKILIAQSKDEISLETIKQAVPSLEKIVLTNAEEAGLTQPYIESYKSLIDQSPIDLPSVDISDTDPALIMYTSGTTGTPKGIVLNYKHLEGSPRAMEHFVDLSERDVKLTAIPFSHIGGFIYIQNCLIFGITLVIMGRFNPMEFLKNVQQYKVTCFHIVPAMYTALLTLKQIEKFDLSTLRWVVVFGAPSAPEILERFHKFCPNARLLNGWGMTETCPPNTVTPFESDNIASVGKPAPHCKINIVDEGGQEVPIGQVGEIIISGWIVMEGYYKDPETTQSVKKDGWLHTGDLGRFDDEGFLYIVGRKKEMIKVGGQIVYAPEVEAVFYKHEAVLEAAVIGISDKLRGEVVKAVVVLKEGMNVSTQDLRYFSKEHLAHFKVPQVIELRETLPKNRTGKIDKELLKQEAA